MIHTSKALQTEWLEVSVGILNMLADVYKGLCRYDKALELLKKVSF